MSELIQRPIKRKRSIGVFLFGLYFIAAGLGLVFISSTFETSVYAVKKYAIKTFAIRVGEVERMADKFYKNNLVQKSKAKFEARRIQEKINAPLPASFVMAVMTVNMTAFLFMFTGILVLMLWPLGRGLAFLTTALNCFCMIPLVRFIVSDTEILSKRLNELVALGYQISGKQLPPLWNVSLYREAMPVTQNFVVGGLIVFVITWWFFTRSKVKEQFSQ